MLCFTCVNMVFTELIISPENLASLRSFNAISNLFTLSIESRRIIL